MPLAGEDAFLWLRSRRTGAPLVLLVGHYDTVPAQENVPGRIEHGIVHGCGASDMKGGVALAIVATFVISSGTGLMKGIRILSDINAKGLLLLGAVVFLLGPTLEIVASGDRKSTRLNSSHRT